MAHSGSVLDFDIDVRELDEYSFWVPPAPRLALVKSPRHCHTYTYPVFTERRFGSLPLLTGYCCACGHVLETGTI